MILDLREFEDFPAETRLEAVPGEFSPFDNSVFEVETVEVDLAIQKSGLEYFCQGQVWAQVRLECARCLVEFRTELSCKTNFIVCSDTSAGERKDIIDDEDYVHFKGDNLWVDIGEPVRQALVLELPMKPLCSKDCQGL